jgi:uncharacterized membrane protein YhaH (DUF805 family)
MNFIEAVKSVFKNYANFNGRASRAEYWWFFLFSGVVAVALTFLDLSINGGDTEKVGITGTIFSLGTIVPSIAVAVRRMHDVGKSGWYILIPLYNLILACTEGQKGDNEYGSDPYGDGLSDDVNAIGNN